MVGFQGEAYWARLDCTFEDGIGEDDDADGRFPEPATTAQRGVRCGSHLDQAAVELANAISDTAAEFSSVTIENPAISNHKAQVCVEPRKAHCCSTRLHPEAIQASMLPARSFGIAMSLKRWLETDEARARHMEYQVVGQSTSWLPPVSTTEIPRDGLIIQVPWRAQRFRRGDTLDATRPAAFHCRAGEFGFQQHFLFGRQG